ncbi:MAG: M48 family metalloprotease [Methylococcaceae bacterium]|nr:M48 family metalloprotease [Methylococcaceae bacterium]
MISYFIHSGILATLCFASIISLLSALLYPKVRNKLAQIPCQSREKILTLWSLSPIVIGISLTFFGLLPSEIDNHEVMTDHCSSHENGIAHLCWFDPIVHISDVAWMFALSLMAIMVIFNSYKAFNLLIKHWKFQTTLHAISKKEPQRDIFQIASEKIFVFSSGLFVPHAFISSTLLNKLSTQQLDVVLAHEQAHCQRRDVLRRLLLSCAALFHFPKTRQQLLDDLELAHEQICDIAAIKKVGDRFLVAETIIEIARQLNTLIPTKENEVMAFCGSHIDLRVKHLLEQPNPVRQSTLFFSALLFSLVLIGILTLTMPLHHFL